jgi:uncharacterized protein affecting Mg2+/Co2+ transport
MYYWVGWQTRICQRVFLLVICIRGHSRNPSYEFFWAYVIIIENSSKDLATLLNL